MRYLFILLFSLICSVGWSQYTILGKVANKDGEPLVGAVVYESEKYAGTTTNDAGVFKIELSEGEHVVIIEHLGYRGIVDSITVTQDDTRDYTMRISPLMSAEFVVEATRANATTPISYQNITKEELEQNNLAQDMPILLNQTISAVTTSDAGGGVGYTGIRIRGSDATRINVTVNGVPLNDSESHGVFWVNMPDFASSTENIQIQRGVGTSTNGTAAFGASINLETTDLDSNAFVELNNSYGSFNTRRHNAIINSGLINNHFNFEGRLSYIGSDGYIDRASADLRSYYFAGGYYRKKFMLKALTFSGREVTQQAWNGTPESRINGNDQEMLAHAERNGLTPEQTSNLLNSGRTYNFYEYDNEIDRYGQDHYQLITGYQITPALYLNITGHYTRGQGYFEQYNPGEDLNDFGIDYPIIGGDTVQSSDLIVRRWLDNHFYGGVYSLQYQKNRWNITLGGAVNEYRGDHFGEVIWTQFAGDSEIRDRYYESSSVKLDVSEYAQAEVLLGKATLFADVQTRFIAYKSEGVDNDQRPINIDEEYLFINPKAGVSVAFNSKHNGYFSVARGSREPVRSDFTDAAPGVTPKPEFLTNAEMGWAFSTSNLRLAANGYFMYYEDQLVSTGEVNDVGAPVRTNVAESYRAGIELQARATFLDGFFLDQNLTLSQNRILEFNETVVDYTNGFDLVTIQHQNTDIAFSPSVIAGSQLGYRTKFGLEAAVLSKYIGRQFLDNTSNRNRSIDPYLVNDVRISYDIPVKFMERLQLTLLVNNVLDERYSANGYTFSYIVGETVTENFYYPQAGRNYLVGLKARF